MLHRDIGMPYRRLDNIAVQLVEKNCTKYPASFVSSCFMWIKVCVYPGRGRHVSVRELVSFCIPPTLYAWPFLATWAPDGCSSCDFWNATLWNFFFWLLTKREVKSHESRLHCDWFGCKLFSFLNIYPHCTCLPCILHTSFHVIISFIVCLCTPPILVPSWSSLQRNGVTLSAPCS